MFVLLYKVSNLELTSSIRDIAQLGRAPALGAGGRRFKSYYPERSFLNYLQKLLDS
jgi:hypothetical protein